jgi:ankyrin repeat protein
VVTKLIAAGALVEEMTSYTQTYTNYTHPTPLQRAALFGHLTVVTKLIEAGANVNTASRRGSTPLCIAAVYGRTAVVSKLLQHGADKSIRGREYGTPLEAVEFMEASTRHKNHAAIVALLA